MLRNSLLFASAIGLMLAFSSCEDDSLSASQDIAAPSTFEPQARNSSFNDPAAATLTKDETVLAYEYLESLWGNIEAWRRGAPGKARTINVDEAVGGFENLINIHAGDNRQVYYEREMRADVIQVPAGTRGQKGKEWTGRDAASVYESIVRTIINRMGDKHRLVVVDIEKDPQNEKQIWVTSICEVLTGTPVAPFSFDQVWGPELGPLSVVPAASQIVPTCDQTPRADQIISNEVNSELARPGNPFSVAIGLVRTNPGGPVGLPGSNPQGVPVLVDLGTYNYPTGSTNFNNRGEFMNHSDFGREEICFSSTKIANYGDDGETLARTIVEPLMPPGTIQFGPFTFQRPRRAFAANYFPGSKAVFITPPGGPSVQGTERFHDAAFFFGAYPFFAVAQVDRLPVLCC